MPGIGDAVDALDGDHLALDYIHHPVRSGAQPVIVAPVEGLGWVWVVSQLADGRADGTHPVLVCHVAARRCSRRGRPFDLHWPASSSVIASSWETAPGRPAAAHSRWAASVASISASSRSSAGARRATAWSRRSSDSGTIAAASPPRWITSYGSPGSGLLAGCAVMSPPYLARPCP